MYPEHRLLRPAFAMILLALSACAPQYIETVATSEQDLPARRATFAQSPEPLNETFTALCDSPGDVVRQVSASVVQCRMLPPPDFAAFLVLQYDGALQAPALVVQKQTAQKDDAYVVELSYFAEVMQKSGSPRRVYFRQRRMDAVMDGLLTATGGVTDTR
jgi:hypothetical protein